MAASISDFNNHVWQYYQTNKRDFPWRKTTNPYFILVSEVMLQQTQTSRVVSYYEKFTQQFPSVESLAKATTQELLSAWRGLGYNRRALFLKQAAEEIVKKHNATLPVSLTELVTLPGIGQNTAGAILAYAFNQPALFIETNIRKTIIAFFFASQPKVTDREIIDVLEKAMDRQNPREWYWAVVDYGAMLGKNRTITNDRSQHYRKQSAFIGSKRFYRSQILQALLQGPVNEEEILQKFPENRELARQALDELLKEGFVTRNKNTFRVSR